MSKTDLVQSAARDAGAIRIAPVTAMAEFERCVEVQLAVWGYSDGDLIPKRVFICGGSHRRPGDRRVRPGRDGGLRHVAARLPRRASLPALAHAGGAAGVSQLRGWGAG